MKKAMKEVGNTILGTVLIISSLWSIGYWYGMGREAAKDCYIRKRELEHIDDSYEEQELDFKEES